jgi:hypothetical protein
VKLFVYYVVLFLVTFSAICHEIPLVELPIAVTMEKVLPLRVKSKLYTLRQHPLKAEATKNTFWLIKDSDFDPTKTSIEDYGVAVSKETKEQWDEYYFGFLEMENIQLFGMVNGMANRCLIRYDVNSRGLRSLTMFFEYEGEFFSASGEEFRIQESLDLVCYN